MWRRRMIVTPVVISAITESSRVGVNDLSSLPVPVILNL